MHERDFRLCRRRLWSCTERVRALRDLVLELKKLHEGMAGGTYVIADQIGELESFLANAADTVAKDDVATTCRELKDCRALMQEVMHELGCKVKNGSFHCWYHKNHK